MYHQVYDPVSGSLGLSSIFAALPLITLFVLLGGFKLKAHWAGLASLGVAMVVAIVVYSMPVGQTFDSAAEGAAFGLFPIMWIVINAVWIFRMTEASGHFKVLQRSFGSISDDQRVQAVIIAFAFGALLEALAGFGTPVAICSVMLVGLGFKPAKAVALALVADTAPVAFGAIAIPITTLSGVTGLPQDDLGAMVGRQTPLLALVLPLIMVAMVDGRRGLRETWPVALVGGSAFAVGQFVSSNYISVELADVIASLASVGSMVAFLRVWQPARSEARSRVSATGRPPAVAGSSTHDAALEGDVRRRDGGHDTPRDIFEAYVPYIVIIAVFIVANWVGPAKDFLTGTTQTVDWPGLHVLNAKGVAPKSVAFKFDYLAAAGTMLLLSGLITMAILRIHPRVGLRSYGQALRQLGWAILTVATVLALAYVMNLSGQTITIGTWIAGAGSAFAFFSPMIGWLGTSITGSDTSSNSLFGALQVTAAHKAHLSATLMAASNSSGGVLGKMISPQNLAIGAAAVGLGGKEGHLFRSVLKWSLILMLAMCALAYLQSTSVLSWMVP
jgi:lactate permease